MIFGPWRIFLLALLFPALSVRAPAAEISGAARVDRMLGPPFTVRARASLGPAEAAVIVIEASDFRCEHCRLFHERVFPRIKARFVDPGLVRYVVLPVTPAGGEPAPELFGLAKFALESGRFWESRGALFAHAGERDVAVLAKHAGLDGAAAKVFVRSAAARAAIAADQAEAARLEVTGTPTFIVRRRAADGNFDEAWVEGYESWEYFNRLLTDLLRPEAR